MKVTAANVTEEQRAELEEALLVVQAAQTLFWNALNDMEALLGYGVDLDSGTDYEEWDIDHVIGLLGPQQKEEDGDDAE